MKAPPSTYQASVERDGRFWLVRVSGVGRTQARHLRELEAMTTDLIATMTDHDPETISVEYRIQLPAPVRRHLERAERLRTRAAEHQHDAAVELRAAARQLARDHGLSLRDIGRALGISHQRAHQLLAG